MRLFERVFSTRPVLESQVFDSILTAGASQDLDEQQIDPQKIQQLERHEPLLDALDQWIQAPNPNLYPALAQLSAVVREYYTFPPSLTLYRGFDLQSPYQNLMGLASRGAMGNMVKKGLMCDNVHYYDGDEPISCTTDEEIAKAYGPCVVRLQLNPNLADSLVITPELCALVCKRRGVDIRTQKEVILLPPVNIEFAIHCCR